jgi:hypothetical protein
MAAKNPILTDAAVAQRFAGLPPDAKQALYEFARWLYRYAADQAEVAWRKKKAPMAVYWSTVKAWAFHISRSATWKVPHEGR